MDVSAVHPYLLAALSTTDQVHIRTLTFMLLDSEAARERASEGEPGTCGSKGAASPSMMPWCAVAVAKGLCSVSTPPRSPAKNEYISSAEDMQGTAAHCALFCFK